MVVLPAIPSWSQCKAPLERVRDYANRLVADGDFLTAIRCYHSFDDSGEFEAASINLQERFLFEYVNASMLAGSLDPRHYERAVEVARRYVDWCHRIGFAVDRCRRSFAVKVSRALGEALQKLRRPTDVVLTYESIAMLPGGYLYFADTSLVQWRDALLMINASQERWCRFRSTLGLLAELDEIGTRTLARSMLQDLTCT